MEIDLDMEHPAISHDAVQANTAGPPLQGNHLPVGNVNLMTGMATSNQP